MDRKRKNDNTSFNKLKKQKTRVDWSKMVSGSTIRNYMIDDPLIDWLKYYHINDIHINDIHINDIHINDIHINNRICSHYNDSHNNDSHTSFILNQGLEFEQQVINKLRQKYNVIQIAEEYSDNQDYNKHLETVELMKQGVEIIYQGVLHDYNNHIYGTPDLLIRSDMIKKIFPMCNLDNNTCSVNNSIDYVVVDIKHSTLYLDTNRKYLKNIGNTIAYKGQLNIYNRLLMSVQGYFPRYAFILGKRHIYTKNTVTIVNENYLESFATVDFEDYDKFINDKVSKAIEWIINMRTNGHTWKILPKPSVNELYPNMKNKDNSFWKIKSEIADKIGEITNIWWCGFNKRELSHKNKIYSWRDRRFSSKILNISNKNIANTIDNIVNINRSRNDVIRVDDLIKNDYWRESDDILEFYIDFEVINSNIGQLSDDMENIDNSVIFMIGLGHCNKNNKFKFKTFILKENNNNSEMKMIKKMWKYIGKINKNNLQIRFIHWSNAEITFYNRFLHKHPNTNIPLLNESFDLYKLFVNNNIVIKDALNFSLKSIAGAMHKHKMIDTIWDNSNCVNGLQAMMLAYNIYNNNEPIKNNKTMEEISRYNKIDCKVMFDILTYLRNNY